MGSEGRQLTDEMNLIEFLRTLWQQKRLILLTTILCLGLGLSYILLSKPVYEATGHLSPPTIGDLSAINQGRSASKKALLMAYEPQNVYEVFSRVLQADSTKRLFFESAVLPAEQIKESTSSEAKLWASFSSSLTVKAVNALILSDKFKPADYIVSYRGTSPKQDADFVQGYIEFAREKAVDEFWLELNQQRDSLLERLQAKINSIRNVANNQRLDRIEQLQEAVKVAQAVDMNHAANGLITDASVINNPSMMYLRGTKALQAEIDNLSSRKSSDAFVAKSLKLRETQGLYDFYKNIVFNKGDLRMFRMDSEVMVPDFRVAPRKKLILLLSIFAGIFLGVSLAILRKPLALIVR
ncbi:chain length determinant protein WzzB [Legionella massiliensis]|uniref:Chain length determinant protein WzzB n=1 Tax=Legionella massiliensis TaxID=1034943 RepID=A0A078KWG2_9GAMM|nr:Wzz/FepE/Etk N-terminal domain-containing protein [Legionella massiliensis]CDZ78805.1 chain length determinant protein WzzB [Legionella massiliensis]CEE14543.1 lipopolysaccharide biosynthesis protein WzzE [Legionella massiliensis]